MINLLIDKLSQPVVLQRACQPGRLACQAGRYGKQVALSLGFRIIAHRQGG
jgi:hypothetical protein